MTDFQHEVLIGALMDDMNTHKHVRMGFAAMSSPRNRVKIPKKKPRQNKTRQTMNERSSKCSPLGN